MSEPQVPARDPGTIAVGEFVKSMPIGKLLGLVGALVGAGFAAGHFVRGALDDALVHELRAQADQERRQAQAQTRVAETLQQAIAAGHCVKSREIMRADAARTVVARLAVLKTEADTISAYMKSKPGDSVALGLNEIGLDPSVLAYFIDDDKVTQLLADVAQARVRYNVTSDNAALEPFRTTVRVAQTYFRAKYLPLDPIPTPGDAKATGGTRE